MFSQEARLFYCDSMPFELEEAIESLLLADSLSELVFALLSDKSSELLVELVIC